MTDTLTWKFPIDDEVKYKDGYGTKRLRKLTWRVTGHDTQLTDEGVVPAYHLAAIGAPEFAFVMEPALKHAGYAINMDLRVNPKGPDWHSVVERTRAAADAMAEEIVTDPNTGGQKGKKLARFDLIPPNALRQLAEHYGRGEIKYPSEDGVANWRKGYDWSLSYAALQRHLNAFWSGEDYDEETGSLHLVAAAWHCFALIEFKDQHPEKDNRPHGEG